MSSQTTSFHFSPTRQGMDLSSWKVISGVPTVTSGRMNVGIGGDGIVAHYADIMRGDISFNVNTAAPAGLQVKFVGLASDNTPLSKVGFAMTNTLVCVTSDGVDTTTSDPLTWSADWTTTNTEFRIRWEAGMVKFYIAGTCVFTAAGSAIPKDPLNLYITETNAGGMTIGNIAVKGTQSFVMNTKVS